jgi:hypothetical protein
MRANGKNKYKPLDHVRVPALIAIVLKRIIIRPPPALYTHRLRCECRADTQSTLSRRAIPKEGASFFPLIPNEVVNFFKKKGNNLDPSLKWRRPLEG